MKTEPSYLACELMDVVRLFPGAEALEIEVFSKAEKTLSACISIDGTSFSFSHPLESEGDRQKSEIKRDLKLDLYELLSARFQRELPWGSLTGIRPTRLARAQLEKGKDFRPLFQTLRVSEENISLVERVIKSQEGIYERKEGNEDYYLSIPFCPSKCDYCSFVTAPIAKTKVYLRDYLAALKREYLAFLPSENLRSIYIGGGTPFVLEEEELEEVLSFVSAPLKKRVEFTVEAGRADVFTKKKLDLCLKYGVTRICVNAQSFSDRTLHAIGRKSTRAQLYSAFEMAKDYPFLINCDLIAGLTGETLQEFCDSVDEAISLSPENITVHTLCLKKGAKLKEEHLPARGHQVVFPLDDGLLPEMIAYSRSALTKAGYEPYYLYRQKYMAGAHENVGWTKKGCASIYNIDVMEETADNLAFGANAVSKKIFLSEGRIERVGNPKDIPTYLSSIGQSIEKKRRLFG